jgi:hypothetical protein
MAQTTFSGPVVCPGGFIGPAFGGMIPFSGTYYYVNPLSGADGNTGTSPAQAFKTLDAALSACTEGNNDVVFLISEVNDGTTTSATLTANLNWNKDSTHLVGICAPTMVGQRARIAASGTTFTPLITLSANNCYFSNVSIWGGFGTGGASNITLNITGSRNAFENVSIQGLADATSAGGTGARVMKITGGGENTFSNCSIGVDTVQRTAANYTVELAGGTARNIFRNCLFPSWVSSGGTGGAIMYAAAASAIDRYTLLDSCLFINAVSSTGSTLTDVVSLPASAGGMVVMRNCITVGFTGLGTATAISQMYIDMAAPSNSAGGLAVTPSA